MSGLRMGVICGIGGGWPGGGGADGLGIGGLGGSSDECIDGLPM
jgi:hypothetical protein